MVPDVLAQRNHHYWMRLDALRKTSYHTSLYLETMARKSAKTNLEHRPHSQKVDFLLGILSDLNANRRKMLSTLCPT
jgi:hypothetical protein